MKKIILFQLILLLPLLLFSKEFNPESYNKVLEETLQNLKNVTKDKKAFILQSIELIKKSQIDNKLKRILTAKSYLVLFNLTRAKSIADSILKDDAKNKEAFLIKGLALRYTGDHTESLKCLQNALIEKEINEYKLFEISIAYLLVNKPDQAIKYLKKICELYPNNLRAKIKLGGAWLNADKPDQAIKIYEEALKLKPNNNILLYNIGHVAYYLNQTDKAILHLKKALQINPNDWLAIQKLVQIYDKNSNTSETAKYHKKMISLRNSNNAPNLKTKASYIMGKTKIKQWAIYAIYYFEKSTLLANQISFSIIDRKIKKETIKFNLVTENKNSKDIFLLNIYFPNKTIKIYLSYKNLPSYETIKKDILNYPLFVSKKTSSKKKK
ncbi:MAG: hypothetical protein COA79_23645 [Planctomycetota bacterium]|nr:MAG: hypothetical protein COA79_23645 [Planctomycetota bacterium]